MENPEELVKFFDTNKFENYAGDVERLINEVKYVQALRTFNMNINNKVVTIDDIICSLKIFEKPKEVIPDMYI